MATTKSEERETMANPRHNGAQLATQPQLTIGEKDKAIATY